MGIENGSGIPVFNSETLSRSVTLAEKIRTAGVLGEKSEDERDKADEKAREILDTSFEVKNADGQIHNVEYTSVEHMIDLSQSSGLTDDAKERTKMALYEIGLALSQDKVVFKAATEGEEELKKVLPPSLHGIQPYLLSSYLTDGKGDTEGQGLVVEMTDLFKLKSRADKRPEYYKDDFESKAKDLFTKLMDKCDDATPEDISKGRVGRWEAMMGFVKGVDDRTRREPVLTREEGGEPNDESTQSSDYEPPVYNKDTGEWEGGSRWELSPEFAAEAMKWMDHAMRWTSYTPPEWFKELPVALQAKIEYMVAVNGAAANLLYAKKDLDKIMSNDAVFGFTHEQLNFLFDDDFKIVYSRMLHDLCELGVQTTDQNGVKCLRYKERYYAFDYKAKDGDGAFLKGSDGGRKIIPETEENLGKGVRTIDVEVFSNIKNIKGYEEKLALFLANYKQKEADNLAISQGRAKRDADGVWQIDKNGNFVLDRNGNRMIVDAGLGVWETWKKNVFEGKRLIHKKGEYILDDKGDRKAGYLCKMNAYTAYNFFYAMGDASLADRKRILPTFNGVISDAIRTLNPEYKARSKWQVEKSGQARHLSEKDFLVESEYFGGPVGRYILTVAKLERDIGRPIDGKKTIMQKIYDGELAPFPDKTYYGFGDFFNTSRDLEFEEDVVGDIGFSFNELMMKYGRFEGSEFIRDDESPKFRFKSESSTTFENEFFDSLDAAILVNRSIMGKEKVDSVPEFGAKITSAFGMVNGIWVGKEGNKRRLFSYTRSPEIWRSVVIGAFGADYTKLSSSYIPISRATGATHLPYNLFVSDILTDNEVGLGINPNEINVNKLMRMLGVDIDPGMIVTPNVIRALKSSSFDREERSKTTALKLEQQKKSYKGEVTDDMKSLLTSFNQLKAKSASEDYKRMVIDFERAVEFEDLSYAKRLLEAMQQF